MEEVYGEKNNRSTRYRDFLWSKSTRFLSHQGQHIPILENEDRQMPHSLSRHCKDFIDSKFDEVMLVIFLLVVWKKEGSLFKTLIIQLSSYSLDLSVQFR